MKFSVPLKENHKALWNWLAKNPEKEKEDWPGWETIRKLHIYPLPPWTIANKCFACGGAGLEERYGCFLNCKNCPCEWGVETLTINAQCEDEKSPFYKWVMAKNIKTRARLALKIADAWR